jgi:FtsP/CotA-like multicopper oxidase with cupredoxin domain
VLLVEEAEAVEVDRDVVLLIEQWQNDKTTPHLTTNGEPRLDVAVRANERVRLRLINATRARALALRLDGLAARVMAIDGQPAEPFLARDSRVTLGPGNRADLFVDITLAAGASVPITVGNAAEATPIARLVCGSDAARAAPRPEPKPLPPNPLPERLDLRAALRQEISLDALATAVGPAHERPPVLRARRGRTVVLTVKNQGETAGVVHLHGHSGRLLDRLDDGWKPFWLDTLVVGGRQTERIAFLADKPGKWAIEGRFLGTDKAFAGWFEVT